MERGRGREDGGGVDYNEHGVFALDIGKYASLFNMFPKSHAFF